MNHSIKSNLISRRMQGQKNHGELGEVSYSTLDIKIVGTNAFAFIVIKEPQRKFLVEKLQRETS